jgi:hypothetical protein
MADSYTVQLMNVSPDALARWLADVRVNAQLTPDMVQLAQVPPGSKAPSQPAATGPVAWQGTVRFAFGN